MKNNYRYIAKIIFETTTPIAVGSGQKGLTIDRLIARDVNQLPYIPGTSLAGVIRHELEDQMGKQKVQSLFGYQDLQKNKGEGSRIQFSSAHLVSQDGKSIHDGLIQDDFRYDDYYGHFFSLPERDHVKITEKGVADKDNHAKFDEQLVYKGTRFGFEMELLGTDEDKAVWDDLLNILTLPYFRLGAGTRNGFGGIKIIPNQSKGRIFNLGNITDLQAYLEKTTSLNDPLLGFENLSIVSKELKKWEFKKITLQPENFFLFGAGVGDNDVDLRPKTEKVINWTENGAAFSSEQILIPATSVKGAIAHRLAFHYNENMNVRIENLSRDKVDLPNITPVINTIQQFDFGLNENDFDELKQLDSNDNQWDILREKIMNASFHDFEDTNEWKDYNQKINTLEKEDKSSPRPVLENNDAVKTLFGFAKQEQEKDSNGQLIAKGARGKVIFSDVFLKKEKEKIFSHVAIDRFTGGGIDGALFQEKVAKTKAFELEIYIEQSALIDEHIKSAWDKTLDDLKNGNLPLGGSTLKGHGIFLEV